VTALDVEQHCRLRNGEDRAFGVSQAVVSDEPRPEPEQVPSVPEMSGS